jgi:hypothetical protein
MRLPFTESEFLDLFAAYNAAVWPVVFALWVATCAFVIQLARGRASTGALCALAAVHWLWSGLVYHAIFFTRINTAAWLFALLFLAQAFAFVVYAIRHPRATFTRAPTLRPAAAAVFLIYSLLYPALVAIAGHPFPRGPAFAVPCPTTLFTAGILLAATAPPWWLVVVPVVWSLIAGTAALSLGITPDLMLFAAAACLMVNVAVPGVFDRRSTRTV